VWQKKKKTAENNSEQRVWRALPWQWVPTYSCPHSSTAGAFKLGVSHCFLFQVPPQLSSRGRVDPFPDSFVLRKSGCAWNWTQDLLICSQEVWPQDHRGGPSMTQAYKNEFPDTTNASILIVTILRSGLSMYLFLCTKHFFPHCLFLTVHQKLLSEQPS
jgi:hypothetical protein